MKHIYQTFFEDSDLISILFATNMNKSIYDDFGDKNLIKTFHFMPEVVKLQKKVQRKTKDKYNFLNIMDDQIGNNIRNSRTLQSMIKSYRNSKMSLMISCQYAKDLNRSNRSNINYVMFGNMNTDEAIRDVVKDYVGAMFNGMKLSMAEKIAIYRKCTMDYRFILMNMMTNELSYHKLKFN